MALQLSATPSKSYTDKPKLYHAIVTGCTQGIGLKVAEALVEHGYAVTFACRNVSAAEQIARSLSLSSGNKHVDVIHLDLNSLASVRAFAETYLRKGIPLHCLVNNAGVLSLQNKRTETIDGFESHVGVNYLGHFLLTRLLCDLLIQSSPSVVINTTSVMHYFPRSLEDLQSKSSFNTMMAYSKSKLALLYFTDEFNRRFNKCGVKSIAVHPGIVASNIFNTFSWWLRPLWPVVKCVTTCIFSNPTTGAKPPIYVATHPELWLIDGFNKKDEKKREEEGQPTSLYFGPSLKQAWRAKLSHDGEIARQLWEESEALCGLVASSCSGVPSVKQIGTAEEKDA